MNTLPRHLSRAALSAALFLSGAASFAGTLGFNGTLNLEGASSTVGPWCTHTGISVACDRALQGLAVGGVAINTANPGDLQVDSSNVPRAPMQCKQGPAPACSYGYQSGPTYDSTSCSWNYSCVPQSPQPPASVCPNGFASGPTFNAASNSWSYSCNVCSDVAQTPVACSTYAGQYGIPAGDTVGSASWTKNSCSGAITYTGGCSAPTTSPGSPAQQTGPQVVSAGVCPFNKNLSLLYSPPSAGFGVDFGSICYDSSNNLYAGYGSDTQPWNGNFYYSYWYAANGACKIGQNCLVQGPSLSGYPIAQVNSGYKWGGGGMDERLMQSCSNGYCSFYYAGEWSTSPVGYTYLGGIYQYNGGVASPVSGIFSWYTDWKSNNLTFAQGACPLQILPQSHTGVVCR